MNYELASRSILQDFCSAQAGFRPCLRCRPEQSPGTPDWCGVPEIVGRALRLIAAESLDDDRSVGRVAERPATDRHRLTAARSGQVACDSL